MCDVPSVAVFCTESIECFPGTVSSFLIIIITIIIVVVVVVVVVTVIITCLKIIRTSCVPGKYLSLPTKCDIYIEFIHLQLPFNFIF